MENLSAHKVGSAFCDYYYKVLQVDPDLLSGFYDDPTDPDSHNPVSTVRGIDEVLTSLNISDYHVVIRTTQSQFSLNNGIVVVVSGSFVRAADNCARNFTQTFFLASRPPSADGRKQYFVLNDILTFDADDCSSLPMHPAAESTAVIDEENGRAVENSIVESPVASVKTEAPLPNGCSTEEVVTTAVKNFASVVRAMQRNPAPIQVRVPQPKSIEQHRAKHELASPAAAAATPTINGSVGKKTQSAPTESHGIFVPSLPLNATVDDLDKVFKQFGPIKTGGIKVRSNKQHGTCFGFVEYESASSVESALKASPIAFGSRNLFIKEKRPTKDGPKFSSERNGGNKFIGNRGNYNNKNNRVGYKEVSGRA